MALGKKPYKGTRDFFPADKRRLDFMFNHMKTAAEKFSYEPYDGPLLEETDLYRAKSGEELINDQIYSFIDRGEREVAIRPEMTPTVARMVAQIHREVPKPIRWYSIPNLMRYEKPQKGRLREHWQFNCDIFGAPENLGELEIIQVAIELMTSFGATSDMFEILINDRHIVDDLFSKTLKLDDKQTYKLYKVIDKAKKVDQAALDKMILEIITAEQKVLFDQYLNLKSFDELFNYYQKNNLGDNLEKIKSFYDKIKFLKLETFVKYDPTIVRGLDYYTGIVFEIFDKNPENRRAICGGGSYANLLQIFNEQPLAGVGFGLGDVTLTDFLQTHGLLKDFSTATNNIFITYQSEDCENFAINYANSLRKAGLKVELYLGTIKPQKAFPLAEKKGHSFVALIGTNELNSNKVRVKNLVSGNSADVEATDASSFIEFSK